MLDVFLPARTRAGSPALPASPLRLLATSPPTLHAVTLLGRIHSLLIVLVGALAIAAASPAVFAQSGVDIEVDQFGVGLFRPGGVVPVRLKLTSNLDKATAVWVQWQAGYGL